MSKVSRQEEASQGEQDSVASKRNDQGNQEVEVLEGESAVHESDFLWARCTKNPGHANFIPVSEFSLDHLPLEYRNEKVLEGIRARIPLTVRLVVRYTSKDRPDGYTFSRFRGQPLVHQGSGRIRDIKPKSGPCPCKECANNLSAEPRRWWYEFKVDTACHVVYNTEEARNTEVNCFFDNKESQNDGRMKSLWGFEAHSKSRGDDSSYFLAATHDKPLGQKLMHYMSKQRVSNPALNLTEALGQPCVVISHPHGQPKKVTVGQVVTRGNSNSRVSYLHYTTDTCAGSSGAPVLVIAKDNSVGYQLGSPVHSEMVPELGVNKSVCNRSLLVYNQNWKN